MLYPVFKLEAVCPLASDYPCCGLGPWAGLERAEGNGLCAPDLASVPPLQQKGSGQHGAGLSSSWPPCPEQPVQAVCECDPARTEPSPPGRRESPYDATNYVQNCQLCSSLTSLVHPQGLSLFPFLLLPCGRSGSRGLGASISKQLRVGLIYLSLGAGPFFRPLPSKMCLLLELLPLNTQFLGSCH